MYFCSFISDLCCRIDFVQAFYTALWGSTWPVPAQIHIQENPGKQSLRTSLNCNRCCEYSLQLLLSPSIKEVLWDSKEARSIDCTDSLMSFAMAGFKQPCNSPCWRGILWDKLAQMKRLYSVIREEQVIFTYYMHTTPDVLLNEYITFVAYECIKFMWPRYRIYRYGNVTCRVFPTFFGFWRSHLLWLSLRGETRWRSSLVKLAPPF